MNITAKLLIAIVLACALPSLRAQTRVEVSPPALSLKSGKVHIEFDLLNSTRSEKFTIRLDITYENGEKVPASSLSGDIGEGVTGGGNKQIIWDMEADSIFLDGDIFVEVYAQPEAPPVAVVPSETQRDEAGPEVKEPAREKSETTAQKEYNRTLIIAQSLAFPGLGLSRINPGKPHWLRGVAGYGCLAGSVYLNRKSWSTYQNYLDPEHPDAKDDVFDQAYDTKRTSQILGYAALGVWVVDIAWTILGTSEKKQNQVSDHAKGFSIGTSVEPVSNVPLIAMRYVF
ncbi:MAG: hypothetical protein V2B15_14865 [Bacteroidota bacterium]